MISPLFKAALKFCTINHIICLQIMFLLRALRITEENLANHDCCLSRSLVISIKL